MTQGQLRPDWLLIFSKEVSFLNVFIFHKVIVFQQLFHFPNIFLSQLEIWKWFFHIIFISKLVSNVFVLLDTHNLLWEWLLTQNIWILMKLNCVCFRIRMMFWLWYQESSKLNFYIKCKQRVEKKLWRLTLQ